MKVFMLSWNLDAPRLSKVTRMISILSLRVSYPFCWIEFLTTVFTIHSHCIASLVCIALRPVILNILVKVLYPLIVCSSLSIATQQTGILPFRYANLVRDNKYLADTKNIAENIYDADKEKANQLMKRWISGIISYANA